ncbi:MAG: YceI family protein [Candidatus Zixiibacteriota bacterium]
MKYLTNLLVVIMATQPSAASAAEYHVNRDADNNVTFYSSAPLEDFEGVTDQIDGYVLWEAGDTPTAGGSFYFEVNLDDLDTGIGLRNRHMRENYLETDKYPFVSFKGSINGVKNDIDSTLEIDCAGAFDLHGVTRQRSITVKATAIPDGYHVTGEFIVRLEDHRIKVPKLMFLKIDQNIRLTMDFFLKKSTKENQQ